MSVNNKRTYSTSSNSSVMSSSYCITLAVGEFHKFRQFSLTVFNRHLFSSIQGRCGAPDVITKERTDHDKAPFIIDYSRKTSFDSASEDSSSIDYSEQQLSFIDEEIENEVMQKEAGNKDSDTESESDDEDNLISQIVAQKSPTRITIKLNVTDKIFSKWDSVNFIQFSILFC